ncbi:MAG: hypothetical protein K0U16_07640 [Gammaproteobacteria bacterium]|nr:hypothetical protein [Gammaproteobacteria bacterium]
MNDPEDPNRCPVTFLGGSRCSLPSGHDGAHRLPTEDDIPQQIPAPDFPIAPSEIISVETRACFAVLEHREPGDQAITLVDSAYLRVYGHVAPTIPARGHRGKGWDNYVAAWMRICACIEAELQLDAIRSGTGVESPARWTEGMRPWPSCPACDAPLADGKNTCGRAACEEAMIWDQHGPPPKWEDGDG